MPNTDSANAGDGHFPQTYKYIISAVDVNGQESRGSAIASAFNDTELARNYTTVSGLRSRALNSTASIRRMKRAASAISEQQSPPRSRMTGFCLTTAARQLRLTTRSTLSAITPRAPISGNSACGGRARPTRRTRSGHRGRRSLRTSTMPARKPKVTASRRLSPLARQMPLKR